MNIHNALLIHAEAEILSFIKNCSHDKIDVRDELEQTPLHIAASQGFTDIVEKLIKKKANISAVDRKGWTPLHFAAYYQNYEICEKLIGLKADLTASTKDGSTVVAYIANAKVFDPKQLKIMELALSKGVDINQPNLHGETALSRASLTGTTQIIDFLLSKGAVVNQTNE